MTGVWIKFQGSDVVREAMRFAALNRPVGAWRDKALEGAGGIGDFRPVVAVEGNVGQSGGRVLPREAGQILLIGLARKRNGERVEAGIMTDHHDVGVPAGIGGNDIEDRSGRCEVEIAGNHGLRKRLCSAERTSASVARVRIASEHNIRSGIRSFCAM